MHRIDRINSQPFSLMHLRYRDLDIPTSWEEAHPGARASRPQPYSCKQPAIQGHSLEQCTKPAFAGFATLVPSPMRAGRPRSRVGRPDGAVERIRGATSLKADRRPLGNSRLSASPAPALPGRSYERAFCNIGSGAGHFAGKRDVLLFQYRVRPGEKWESTTKSTKVTKRIS